MPHTVRICISLATFNPPEVPFHRQITSLQEQTYPHWTCIIQDDHSSAESLALIDRTITGDPRFTVTRNDQTVGFYQNFERTLRTVPGNCELICLADQDDRWYPHKLVTLVDAMNDPDVTLAYGNLRVTDAAGATLAESFLRKPTHSLDFESLFFTNTVPGAAAMFRASLLPKVLPFPRQLGTAYHDWWIALVALAAGNIRYVDQVLQDYCQHGSNAVGWQHRPRRISPARLVTSPPYRSDMLRTAQAIRSQDTAYLGDAVTALLRRVPDSTHHDAMRRLEGLLTRPARTLMAQYLRALRSRRGSRRERNLLLAHLVGKNDAMGMRQP